MVADKEGRVLERERRHSNPVVVVGDQRGDTEAKLIASKINQIRPTVKLDDNNLIVPPISSRELFDDLMIDAFLTMGYK